MTNPGEVFKLDGHRLYHRDTGDLFFDAARGKQRYFAESPLIVNNQDYFTAPKQIGSLTSERLLEVGRRNVKYANLVQPELAAEFLELAGSANIEAAFSAIDEPQPFDNTIDNQDYRIALVDMGTELFELAIERLGEDFSTYRQRLHLQVDMKYLYYDIVCQSISPDTVEETRAILEKHLYATYENTDPSHARGLGGELRELIRLWSQYDGVGSLVALPATVRGDNGCYRRSETHDIDLLRQSEEDGGWTVERPIEVKRRFVANHVLRRYSQSDVYRVFADGSSTFLKTNANAS